MIHQIIITVLCGIVGNMFAMDTVDFVTEQRECAICLGNLLTRSALSAKNLAKNQKTIASHRIGFSTDAIESVPLIEQEEEQDDVIVLKCSHMHAYHFNCLREHFVKNKHATCPYCRASIARLFTVVHYTHQITWCEWFTSFFSGLLCCMPLQRTYTV